MSDRLTKPLQGGALLGLTNLLLETAMALLLAAGSAAMTAKPVTALPASTTYTYTVNSTGDGGDTNGNDHQCIATTGGCTLRAAINQADSNCAVTATISTTINFAIGSGLQTIAPAGGLPPVGCPVVIDGTTQPGYAGKPIVVLDGTATHPNGLSGLFFNARCACGETIQGLVIDNWLGDGLILSHGSPMIVRNNFIGTDPTGAVAAPNRSYGVVVSANDGGVGDTIGGTTAADRNVISGNGFGGVFLTGGATNNVVDGNYIGTNVTGKTAVGNGSVGVSINASGNLVGGAVGGAGNVISGNLADGITICCGTGITNNVIEGNLIGTQAGGSGKLGNARYGISLGNSPGNTTIGGKPRSQWNVIEFNGHDGVVVTSGTGQKILGNSIFSNGTAPTGLDRIGIDLSGCGTCTGVTPNHVNCSAGGPNNYQNFPVISSATSSSTATTLTGTLNCTANTKFLLQFYSDPVCSPSGYGEGKKYLSSTTVTTVGNNVSFQVTIKPAVSVGSVVTSTATDPSGDTSEFSACRTVS